MSEDDKKGSNGSAIIELSNVGKTYYRGKERLDVLKGLNLNIPEGSYEALMGPSGSGKSTLLNLIGLLEPPDRGEVWFDDVCVSRLSRRAQCPVRGRSVGYVFQSFLLITGLTALDNVLLAARYVGRARSDALPAARALMERLGVAHRAGHYPA